MEYNKDIIMLKLITAITLSMSFYVSANNEINYVTLEQKSSDIICKVNPECVPFKTMTLENSGGASFVVGGVTLPLNALHDKEQQSDMIAASLYVTKDGDVLPLPDENEIVAEAEKNIDANNKRKGLLPIKTFPAPVITKSSDKVIIKVK